MPSPDELADETPRKVFVVTQGDYSAYHIVSIWETRAEAEKHTPGKTDYDEARVEEWVLNQQEERTLIQWEARLDFQSGVIVVDEKSFESAEIKPAYVNISLQTGPGYWWGSGYGLSPELARKALADALAKAKAERDGL